MNCSLGCIADPLGCGCPCRNAGPTGPSTRNAETLFWYGPNRRGTECPVEEGRLHAKVTQTHDTRASK